MLDQKPPDTSTSILHEWRMPPTSWNRKRFGRSHRCSIHCIEKAVNKAKSVIGWIKRHLICRNNFVMLNVYKNVVRPHIEYALQAWNPPAAHGNCKLILQVEDWLTELVSYLTKQGWKTPTVNPPWSLVFRLVNRDWLWREGPVAEARICRSKKRQKSRHRDKVYCLKSR